jgi:hypothetical protein
MDSKRNLRSVSVRSASQRKEQHPLKRQIQKVEKHTDPKAKKQ